MAAPKSPSQNHGFIVLSIVQMPRKTEKRPEKLTIIFLVLSVTCLIPIFLFLLSLLFSLFILFPHFVSPQTRPSLQQSNPNSSSHYKFSPCTGVTFG